MHRIRFDERRRVALRKTGKESLNGIGAYRRGKIVKKARKDKFLRPAEIGENGKILFLGDGRRNVKTAVGGKPLKYAFRGCRFKPFSCADELHFI
jgi:hypothetical protein